MVDDHDDGDELSEFSENQNIGWSSVDVLSREKQDEMIQNLPLTKRKFQQICEEYTLITSINKTITAVIVVRAQFLFII